MFEKWLFLFDLDGLLIDSEPLHFFSYQKALSGWGVQLKWSFEEYSHAALFGKEFFLHSLLENHPSAQRVVENWEKFYEEKQKILQEQVRTGKISLMPGAVSLLRHLQKVGIPHIVVTHSSRAFVNLIGESHSLLSCIPHWITREDYVHPKPHAEPYEKALSLIHI